MRMLAAKEVLTLFGFAVFVMSGSQTQARGIPGDTTTVDVVVELSAPPPVLAILRQEGEGGPRLRSPQTAATPQRLLAEVRYQQRNTLADILAIVPGSRLLFSLEKLYNGLALRLPESAVAIVSRLPQVRSVYPLVQYAPATATSVPLIRAPEVWEATGPYLTGDGIRIGIIDSGIDYVHVDFGGTGSYAGQNYDDSSVPWNAKVVGGWDFVGDAYDGTNAAQPDGDPMDCGGHGTHVAGIAAGYGVTSTGQTYRGPYGNDTDFTSLAIGPGVAPGAQLFALKVFGCSGTTGFSSKAIDWAIDPDGNDDFSDHLDVVNLSLGSPFGKRDTVLETLVNRAAAAGMTVVASAGNEGDTFFVTGTPASADRAISVANSVDSGAVVSGFRVDQPASIAGVYPATEATFGPALGSAGNVAGPLTFTASNPDGCGSFPASSLTGKIALIRRGSCTFVDKVSRAQNAGATGVIIANNVSGDLVSMGGSTGNITIPSVFTSQETGALLEAGLAASPVSVTLTAALHNKVVFTNPAAVDTLSSSSSRGPRLGDLALKPDLAAPGSTILSAEARSGSRGISFSGTSMAAPHVTGAVALIRQRHPEWSADDIKEALMNTAIHDLGVETGAAAPFYGTAREGAGRIDVEECVSTDVVAGADDGAGRVSISFGVIEVTAAMRAEKTVALRNLGSSTRSYAVAYQPLTTVPGISVTLPAAAVTVGPGEKTTFEVVLRADPDQLRHVRAPGVAPSQGGVPRYWMAEASGHIVLAPLEGPTLRVPVYAAVKASSLMAAAESVVPIASSSGTFDLHLVGSPVSIGHQSDGAVDSLVVPLQMFAGRSGVRQVGVWSNYQEIQQNGGDTSQAVIAFGLVLGRYSTPHQFAPRIQIGVGNTGTGDYILELTDQAGEDEDFDTFASRLCNASRSSCAVQFPVNYFSPEDRDTSIFNNEAMVLFVRSSALGLGNSNSSFSFRVSAGTGTTSTFTYDIARPGVDFGIGANAVTVAPGIYYDRDGVVLSSTYDRQAFDDSGAGGVLLLHLHNPTGHHAEVVTLSSAGCALACTASVTATAVAGEILEAKASITAHACDATTTVTWDFGDGSPVKTTAQVDHTYFSPGTYTWTMTISRGGLACEKTGVVVVLDSPIRPIRKTLQGRS